MPATLLRRSKPTPHAAGGNLPPTDPPPGSVRRFTLAQYQRMIDLGILGSKDRCHLINGVIRNKMPQNTPHLSTFQKLNRRLARLLPDEFVLLPDLPVDVVPGGKQVGTIPVADILPGGN